MRAQSDATKLRQVRSELRDANITILNLKRELADRRTWGQIMSNICFNLAQNEAYDPQHQTYSPTNGRSRSNYVAPATAQ